MLVLARKIDQTIVINGQTVIKILRRKGNQVWIGIDAPKSVHVRRGELKPESEDAKDNGSSDES